MTRKQNFIAAGLVAVIVVAGAFVMFAQPTSPQVSTVINDPATVRLVSTDTWEDSAVATTTIRIAERTVTVSIVSTPGDQERGLGGRAGLASDEGMLFVFPEDARYAFWMKDMQFAIDIVWLSSDGTIITIAPSVSPNTYPHSFTPAAPARYVVELPAGFAQIFNLKIGDKVKL